MFRINLPPFQGLSENCAIVSRYLGDVAPGYLLDQRRARSARVFRVYREHRHIHEGSDEYLTCFRERNVLDGERFEWIAVRTWRPSLFQAPYRSALPNILEEPVVFLSVDTPRRDPKDIIFVIQRRYIRRPSLAKKNIEINSRPIFGCRPRDELTRSVDQCIILIRRLLP